MILLTFIVLIGSIVDIHIVIIAFSVELGDVKLDTLSNWRGDFPAAAHNVNDVRPSQTLEILLTTSFCVQCEGLKQGYGYRFGQG